MNITSIELITKDLQKQYEFYFNVLDLRVNLLSTKVEIQAGVTVPIILLSTNLQLKGKE